MSMKQNRNRIFTQFFAGCIGIGLFSFGGTAFADTASSTFNFTATFVGGSCEISAPGSIQFNNDTALLSSEIEQQVAATTERFDLTL